MTLAVYPGTFDPITMGHCDLIRRAASLFDQVIVAVALADHKKTLLSFEERFVLVKRVFKDFSSIQVLPLEGLLVDFVKKNKAQAVIRGLRTAADFEYEFQLAGMNQQLDPHIETLFMTPSKDTLFISATLVRELIRLKGPIDQFVPPVVVQFLKEKPYHGT